MSDYQCPNCGSKRVEIDDQECRCFACGFSQGRWDFPDNTARVRYAEPTERVIERVEPTELRPIKSELNDLRTGLLATRKVIGEMAKKKGDGL